MRQTVISASITSDIGSIFHPLFWTFAQVLAFFYSLNTELHNCHNTPHRFGDAVDSSTHRQEHKVDGGDAAYPA